jgi:AcrR family transcriptional regulator
MAYEVIKRRGKAAYRYRVEYIPGPEGARHTRWHYLGVVREETSSAAPTTKRSSAMSTMHRLLDAFERLLTRNNFSTISASAIAEEAGIAHGTFYRHFKSKRELLLAAMNRAAERNESYAQLTASEESLETERVRLKNWMRKKLLSVSEFPALWLTWSSLAQSDPEIARLREELRDRKRAILSAYLSQLHNLGYSPVTDADAASRTIYALILGVLQNASSRGVLAPQIVEFSCSMVNGVVFGDPL